MKKTGYFSIKRFFFVMLLACLFLFNTGCGLDVIEFYYPPIFTGNEEYRQKISSLNPYESCETYYKLLLLTYSSYFYFTADNIDNNSSSTFKGTDVYYKLYTNLKEAMNDVQEIENANGVETYTTGSTYKMKEKNFQRLLYKISDDGNIINNDKPFAPKTASNTNIKILPGSVSLTPSINISTNAYIPIRCNEKSFDFTKYSNNEELYVSSEKDPDFKYTTFSSEKTVYVVMYAVSTGTDYNWNEVYSSALYLGCLPMDIK